jgi:hypothetical protein
MTHKIIYIIEETDHVKGSNNVSIKSTDDPHEIHDS